ncbi:MAG: MFS transporter [Sphingomonadales bacterium]
MTVGGNLSKAFKIYGTPRQIVIACLGFSSAVPLVLVLSVLSTWLAREGVDKSTIGLFAAMGTPYVLKFLWSPLVDRLPIFGLTRKIGRRRAWLFLSQIAVMVAILALGRSDPSAQVGLTAVMAFLVALASATQDIVVDAYRIEILTEEEQGAGAAMINFGYRMGMIVSGSGVLILADHLSFSAVYQIAPVLVLVGMAAAALYGEPSFRSSSEADEEEAEIRAILTQQGSKGRWAEIAAQTYMAVIAPFREFMARRAWLLILIFVMIYKLGDALAAVMIAPLLVELGFSNTEIGLANKLVGIIALIVGGFFGGGLLALIGMYRALLISGILMMVTNLFFAVLAVSGHSVPVLAAAIAFENFASGIGLTVFVAYLSNLCNLAFTATQYALLSSLTAVGRTWLSTSAGYIVEAVGWAPFFIVTTVAALPGLALLVWLWRAGFQVDAAPLKIAGRHGKRQSA